MNTTKRGKISPIYQLLLSIEADSGCAPDLRIVARDERQILNIRLERAYEAERSKGADKQDRMRETQLALDNAAAESLRVLRMWAAHIPEGNLRDEALGMQGPSANYGQLCDYKTGDRLRPATQRERDLSVAQAEIDNGRGVIRVDGRACYVED